MDLSFGEILILLIVIGIIINLVVKNWKGRKSNTTQVIDSLKDLMKYSFSEASGNVVQKINVFLGLSIFLLFLVCLFLFASTYYTKSELQATFLTIVIISPLSFFVILPVCARYTRHRYKT